MFAPFNSTAGSAASYSTATAAFVASDASCAKTGNDIRQMPASKDRIQAIRFI